MQNITYLLGAGASANTIPVVNNLQFRFKDITQFLSVYVKEYNNLNSFLSFDTNIQNFNGYLNTIILDLQWLESEASQFQTIDTLAKQYYLTNNQNLRRLKITLITFFSLEQILNISSIKRDNYSFTKNKEFRYESFFASVINKIDDSKLEINPRIKILSWNYDQQLELALKTFTGKRLIEINTDFQIIPNQKTVKIDSNHLNFDFSKFGCVKLNGTAKFDTPDLTSPDTPISTLEYYHNQKEQQILLGLILKEYDMIQNYKYGEHLDNSILYFNFSWEEERSFINKYPNYYEHKDIAIEIARNTNILVIIGYSFPVFNRNTDKELIDNMVELEKVYIQDPNCDIIKSTLTNGFSTFQRPNKKRVIQFELEKNTTQFLIPYEL